MSKMCICFHGTNYESAKLIVNKGFNRYTFFAKHLEDALEFGGNHIFEVQFCSKGVIDNWQFLCKKKISPDKIVSYKIYRKPRTIWDNTQLREKIFKSNLPGRRK